MTGVDRTEVVRLVLAAAASFSIVVGTVPRVRRIAIARGMTDLSRDRWQQRPTPYLGGAALVAGAVGSAAVLPGWQAGAGILLMGAVVLAGVGLIDDVATVAPLGRVVVEIGVAVTAFFAGARVEMFNDGIDLVVTVCWFVVVTNAFNLLDNMDGAMASVALVIATAIAVIALSGGQLLIGGLAIVMAAACGGFLLYNWHPAQIMMGDAGSLFVGFMVAALALELRPPVSAPASVVGLLLLLGPALFDTSLVVISRLRAGRSILIGGTDHTSHRLMQLGFGERGTAIVQTVAAAALTGVAILVATRSIHPAVAATGVSAACVVMMSGLLRITVYPVTAPRPPVDVA